MRYSLLVLSAVLTLCWCVGGLGAQANPAPRTSISAELWPGNQAVLEGLRVQRVIWVDRGVQLEVDFAIATHGWRTERRITYTEDDDIDRRQPGRLVGTTLGVTFGFPTKSGVRPLFVGAGGGFGMIQWSEGGLGPGWGSATEPHDPSGTTTLVPELHWILGSEFRIHRSTFHIRLIPYDWRTPSLPVRGGAFSFGLSW